MVSDLHLIGQGFVALDGKMKQPELKSKQSRKVHKPLPLSLSLPPFPPPLQVTWSDILNPYRNDSNQSYILKSRAITWIYYIQT